jgi:prepilin-type N-terminal cleavage/methylation domain-containing protein
VNSPRSPNGFTLIEVMIATGLLVVIALGTAQLFALAIRHTLSSRQQLVMTLAAARKADELCAAAAVRPLPVSPPDALERDAEGFADITVDAGMICARRWRISAPPGYAGGAIAIVVRVSVAARGPEVRDVQIVTICEGSAS